MRVSADRLRHSTNNVTELLFAELLLFVAVEKKKARRGTDWNFVAAPSGKLGEIQSWGWSRMWISSP